MSGVIAARLLGPENRGHLALLVLIPTAISQLGNLGLPLAVTYQMSRDRERGAGALRNVRRPAALLVTGLIALHAAILVALVAGGAMDVQLAALISLLIIPADSAQVYGLAILQGRRDFAAFNTLRLLPAVAYGTLAVASSLLDVAGLPQFTLWYAGSYAVVSAVTITTALRRSKPHLVPGAPSAGEMARFGARGLLGTVSPLETLRLDQAIVGLFLSPTALGLYVVGVSFTNLPRFIAQSIGFVAYPNVAAHRDPREARRSMWRFVLLSVAASVVIIVALELTSSWLVPTFYGPAFEPAVGILQIMLVASLFLSARRVLTDTSRGIGRPGLGAAAEVVSWLALIPAVIVLAPRYGPGGVALAFTISAGVSLAVLVALVVTTRPADASRAEPRPEEVLVDPI